MSKQCTDDINIYDNVEHCMGSVSLPGTRDHCYMVRRSGCAKIPMPKGNAAETLDEVATIVENILMKADEKFVRIQLAESQVQPTSEQQGSEGSYSFLNKAALIIQGTQKQATGLISKINNDDVIFIIPQRDGKCRLFGNKMFKVKAKPGQDWGKEATETNKTTIEIEVTDLFPAPFYEGVIDVVDYGTIDGKTDELKEADPIVGG